MSPDDDYDGSYYAKGYDVFRKPQLKASGNVSLGYIVCTAMAEENAPVIAAALSAHDDLLAALLPLVFSDPDNPPPGVKAQDWFDAVLNARAARNKAEGK